MKWQRSLASWNIACFFTLLPILPAAAATWIAGNGDWETAANWDTGVVPDAAGEFASISGPGNATVQLNSSRTVGNLFIESGSDRLNLSPGSSLQVAGNTLENRGIIELQANAGQFSQLVVQNAASFPQSGTIRFGDDNLATSLELNSTLSIPTQVALTIEGSAPGLGRGAIDGVGALALGDFSTLNLHDLNFFNVDVPITGGTIDVTGDSNPLVIFNSPTMDLQNGALSAMGNSTVRLNGTDTTNGDFVVTEDAKIEVNGGSFFDGGFVAVDFQSGTIDFSGFALFPFVSRSSTLKGAATMRTNGQFRPEGILSTESGATISAASGEIIANGFVVRGSGLLNINAPIVVGSTGLTFDHTGTVSLGGSSLNLESGNINIDQATVVTSAQSLAVSSLRDGVFNLTNGATLDIRNADTARLGITSSSDSNVIVSDGSLSDVKFAGGTVDLHGFVTVQDSLDWSDRVRLHRGATLHASGGDVSLFGSGELEFVAEPASAAIPSLQANPGSQFVIPAGESLVMSGKQGSIQQTEAGGASLRIDGSLVVSAEEVEFGAESWIIPLGTGSVIQGGKVRILGTLNMNPAESEGSLAASSTGPKPGGTLIIEAGSEIALANGSTIQGGTVQSTDDGVLRVEYSTLQGGFATLEDVDLQALMKVPGQADLGLRGTVVNTGRVELGEGTTSSTQSSDVFVYGEVNLAGEGAFEWTGAGKGRILPQPGTSGEPSHLINSNRIMTTQSLTFGTSAANALAVTNRGTITAEDDLEFYMATGEEVVNEGSIRLTTPDSRLFFRTGGSVIRNSGEIDLADPGSRIIVGNFIQDGGMTKGLGTLQGDMQLNAGTLQLAGVVDGTITFNSGVIEIGDPVGRLQLTRDFNQSTNTTLRIDVGGTTPETEFDLLDVQGFFGFLGGPLEVSLVDLGGGIFLPDSDDTFQIVQTANSVTGAFTNVAEGARLTTTDGLGSFVVNYGFNSPFGFNNVVLSDFVFDPSADFDNDGDVDQLDLAAWHAAYGLNSNADSDSDNDSDGLDFLRWQRQFGTTNTSLADVNVVPEPSTMILIALATALLPRRKG